MKYRTKLYLALAGTTLISSLTGFGVLFYEFRHHAFSLEQSKAVTVAATTAVLINAEPLKSIHVRADEGSPAYMEVKKQLLKVRNANRRRDIFIKFIYTLRPDPKDPQQLIYLVDAEESAKDISHVEDIDDIDVDYDIINHLKDYYSPGVFIEDQYGVWISGYAPIYDQMGKYVASIGVDISIDRYLDDIQRLTQYLVIGFIIALLFACIGGYILSQRITVALRTLLGCVKEIGQGNLECRCTLQTRDEFEELSNEINIMAKGLQERERLKLNFARYVSQHVMEKILKSENVAKLEGERRKITVLFSDIRQFTHLAEQLPPEQVVSLLNEYFACMLDVIFRYQGTFDKFLGDGLMVEFGAPLDDALQEEHAILTAIEMQKELQKLNSKWAEENKPIIEIGIGVHTGLAVVGNIGSEKRIEYTAIGDTVNVASRLEHASKPMKKKILVSEMTYEPVKDKFKAESLGPITLPGRVEPIVAYSIDIQ